MKKNIVIGTLVVACAVLALVDFHLISPGLSAGSEFGVAEGGGNVLEKYFYDSGELMLVEFGDQESVARSVWFYKNGDVLHQTRWDSGTGLSVFLNEDETVKSIASSREGLLHGLRVKFPGNGKAGSVTVYDQGVSLGNVPMATLLKVAELDEDKSDSRYGFDPELGNPFDAEMWKEK